jgi:hypothetical protein
MYIKKSISLDTSWNIFSFDIYKTLYLLIVFSKSLVKLLFAWLFKKNIKPYSLERGEYNSGYVPIWLEFVILIQHTNL